MPHAPATAPRPIDEEDKSPVALWLFLAGRVGRAAWWRDGLLAPLAAGLAGTALLTIAGMEAERAEHVVELLMLWPMMAVAAKRWHDLGRSSAWALLLLLPVLGLLWTVAECGLRRGEAGANRFGDAPVPR